MDFTAWIICLNLLLFCLSSTSGDISSIYADADHYWDFEQSPVSQITDRRTGTRVTVHESPTLVDSPTGKAIYLEGTKTNSSVDLMEVDHSSCLFDPSHCTSGFLSITMFIKFRSKPRDSINGTQMFFGNSHGTELRQGVSIYYDEASRLLRAKVYGNKTYCSRWLGLVKNLWTHLHITWKSIGELKVYVDGQKGSDGQDWRKVSCGSITDPLPTERMYSLGRGAFPVAYFDNLAIWYQDKEGFTAPWNYITNHDGSTTLSLRVTLWNKPWVTNLSNRNSREFTTMENEVINKIQTIYRNSSKQPNQTVVQQFSSGTIHAHVRITFTDKTSWEESLILQDTLETEGFLGSNASITECTADDGFFCEGLETVAQGISITSSGIEIKFNHVTGIDSHVDLMGYKVLYKRTDTNEWWRAVDIRGGYRTRTISGLKPYKNYSIRVAPYSFRAGGLAGPIVINETKEDVPSTGPVILEAYAINMTTVFVRWNESSIPKEDWNGIPRGFRVHGQGQPCSNFQVPPHNVGLNVSSFTVTGLQAWIDYDVKISGVTSPGHGKASVARIKTNDSVPLQGPRNIRITHTSNHSVEVTWDEVHDCHVHGPVKSYEVHFRDVEGGSVDLMHNVTVPVGVPRRLDFTNLEIYWRYGVRIKAFTTLGTGPLSEEETGRTDEWVPIVAPSNVSAFYPRKTEIRLSWYFENNVRDVLGNLTGFRIFYKLANSSTATEQRHHVGTNDRETDVTGLDIYRFYKFSVAGMTSKGHGVISAVVYLRTLGTAPLHAPVPIVTSNTSSTSLHVTWGEVPPAYHHGEVTGYRVFLEETGVVVANRTFPLDENSTDFTGLKKFTSYSARVRAFSLFGEGPEGIVITRTDEDIPSKAPADVQLFNTSSTSLKVVWGLVPVCCRHGIIRGYRLFLRDNISGAFVRNETVLGSGQEFEVSSLLKYYSYSVSILAFTIKGDGSLSEDVVAMTEEDVPQEAPFNVAARNTSAWSLLVEWDFDPNVRHVLGILLGYHVFYRNLNDSAASWESKAVWDPIARRTIVTGLEEYLDYNMTVTAFTRIGDGVSCPFLVTRTGEHVPRAPPSDIIATNTSSTSLRVNWGEVPFADQLGIIRGYRVFMWRTNQSEEILKNVTLSVPSRNISFTRLEKYTNYTIQILAFTVKGDGNRSEPTVVITDEDIPTWKPAGIAAWNTSSTSILLSWQPLADPYYLHGNLRGYVITYERQDGLLSTENLTLCCSNFSVELTSLDEYVEYRIEVRAFTIKGWGPYIDINCSTAEDAPAAPPQNVHGFNISKHGIRVFWDEVPDRDVNGIILGYRVYFNETSDEVFNQTVEFPTKNTTLSFLRPYTFYSIQVLAFTIKGDGPKSPPIIIRTEEEAPQVYPWNVTAYNSSSTSIFIQWSPIPTELVAGVLREYRIVYDELNYDSEEVKRHVVRLPSDQLFVNLTGLEKYRNYTFEVQGISKFFGVSSPPIVVITDQDVPSFPPFNISSTNTSSTSLLITWDPIPRTLVNGILLGYRVFHHQSSGEQQIGSRRRRRAVESLNQTVEVLPPNATFLKIANLRKFTNYSFRIVAFTSKGDGKISQTFNVSTDEDVPSRPPVRLNAVNLSGPHSINVSWEPVPEGFVHGILLGYRVLYKVLALAGEDIKGSTLNNTTDAATLNTTLEGLQNFAVYEIRVSAFTIKGDGAISQGITAETCRCPLKMTTNWHSFAPYITRQGGSLEGPFPFVLNWAARTCCTSCINGHGPTTVDFEYDKGGFAAEKDNESVVHKIDNEADMSFPIEGYKGQTTYGIYRYVPLMESGGVAFVGSLPTSKERTSFVISVGTACFPMLLVAFLMVTLAGSVMWAIESRVAPEEFPRQFTRGLWEGVWWAYITCTTLGYGDRIPRSFLGKSFAIVWTFFGLVLMSFLLADITSALISFSLLETTNKKVYGARMGAIQASSEYRLGVRKTARMNPEQQYHTYEEISRALENREVEGALIDLYVVSNRKELSSNPRLRVFKVLDYKKTFGVVLAGASMKLEKCFVDFVQWNRGEISRKVEETVKTMASQKESVAEEISSGLFDTSAEQFQFCIISSSALLCALIVCGLIYHIYRATREKPSDLDGANLRKHLAYVRSEMRQEVDEFYRRFSKIISEHKKAHSKEKRKFLKRRSSTNFSPVITTSFRNFADSQTSDSYLY